MELPTIVANAGGAPEIIESGVNGFLIPPNDHLALSEKIVEVLNSPDGLWRIKQNARSYVETRLDARHSAFLTMKVYDAVMLENEKRLQMQNDVLCGP